MKKNMESCNLNKEIKLYYNNDKSEEVSDNNWYSNPNNKSLFKTFNVLKSDPIDNYKKIEFLGTNQNFKKTRTSWENTDYWPDKIISDFNGQDYTKIITNLGEIKNNLNNDDILYWSRLQNFKEKWGGASIEGAQSFGFNYYREYRNGNFYLQFLIREYATCWASSIGGSQFMGVGNGIRLYNDDESIRTKREIFEEKNEFKNLTKWTDQFTKSINYEQYLSIDNKTNFVTNNITSL